MNKIIAYCEFDYKTNTLSDVSYELITKAHELKNQAMTLNNTDFTVEAVVIGDKLDDESIKKSYAAGAQRVVLIKNSEFCIFSEVTYTRALVDYLNTNPTRVILFPATYTGRLIAPRVTTALDTGLVADCTGVEFILKDNEIKLAPTRPTFGAELMATILSKKLPECATIRPKTFQAVFDYSRGGEFVEYNSTINSQYKVKVLKTFFDNSEETIDLSSAKVVLCAGWGIVNGKNYEYVEKLQQLAKNLGVNFASTRKLVDFGIVDYSHQIGQTGVTVVGDLYIGFGVSGAIQHVCGMKNCRTVIAINTDKDAEIFKYSDYKVVGDARTIIDELLELTQQPNP